jgi:hypothetical protein
VTAMRFRFLTDHHLNDRVWLAGETCEVPADFVPSGACEPMDEEATLAFFRRGPQPTPHTPNGLRVSAPRTRWIGTPIPGSPHGRYRLSGLGAHLACDFCD